MDKNAQKEILDSIDIISERKIRKSTPQVLYGITNSVDSNNDTCDITTGNTTYTLPYYGGVPVVNKKSPIVVPAAGISQAFVVGGANGEGVAQGNRYYIYRAGDFTGWYNEAGANLDMSFYQDHMHLAYSYNFTSNKDVKFFNSYALKISLAPFKTLNITLQSGYASAIPTDTANSGNMLNVRLQQVDASSPTTEYFTIIAGGYNQNTSVGQVTRTYDIQSTMGTYVVSVGAWGYSWLTAFNANAWANITGIYLEK